jgi:8-oxo-dGTP pyrophosphatase MutT (NUDIX family)
MSNVIEPLREIAVAILVLPDGRYVLQRRTYDAPIAPGLLGLFGGHIEAGETPLEAICRELAEETSLDISSLSLSRKRKILVPASANFGRDRIFHIFEANIASDNFKVFEGVGAESYSKDELLSRDDVSETVQRTIKKDA